MYQTLSKYVSCKNGYLKLGYLAPNPASAKSKVLIHFGMMFKFYPPLILPTAPSWPKKLY